MIDMGQLPDGRRVQAVDLEAGRLRARVLTLGAIVQDLRLDGIDHPLVLLAPTPIGAVLTLPAPISLP